MKLIAGQFQLDHILEMQNIGYFLQQIKTEINLPQMFVIFDHIGDFLDACITDLQGCECVDFPIHDGLEIAYVLRYQGAQYGAQDLLFSAEFYMLFHLILGILWLDWDLLVLWLVSHVYKFQKIQYSPQLTQSIIQPRKPYINNPRMQNYQEQLYMCYKNPQLTTLIATQIHQLAHPAVVKTYRKYVAITLTLPAVTETYSYKIHPNSIEFVVVLTRGFPCVAPRLHAKTCIISPGFDDCRNLIYEVLGQEEWSHRMRLRDVEKKVEEFLGKLDQGNKSVYYMGRLGEFCLNMVYPIQLIKQIRGTQMYFVFEHSHEQNQLKMYFADISSTHLTLFLTKQQPTIQKNSIKVPNEKDVTSCMLVFVAELGSITELLVNRVGFNEMEIKFVSKRPHNMGLNSNSTVRKLRVRKGAPFIRKLVQNMNNYGILDIKFECYPQHEGHPLPNLQKNKQQQEKALLKQISEAQKLLQHKFNKQNIEQLHNSYQKIVEHYSGNNMPYYAIFVQKISILFQRVDVKLVLETEQEVRERTMSKDSLGDKERERKFSKGSVGDEKENERRAKQEKQHKKQSKE